MPRVTQAEWHEPPEGWQPYGSRLDHHEVELEFSEETGEDGLPLWERPRQGLTDRPIPPGGAVGLRELATISEAWAPELRTEDEALSTSLEFVALRLRRVAQRDENAAGATGQETG